MSLRGLVVGPTGSGKTRFAHAIEGAVPKDLRVVVIDQSSAWEDSGRGALVVVAPEDVGTRDLAGFLETYPLTYWDLSALLDPSVFLDELGRAIMGIGNTLVIVDEAQHFLPAHGAARGFLSLAAEGRKRGISLVALTQSLGVTTGAGLTPLLTRNLSFLVVMSGIRDPRELERLTALGGVDLDLSKMAPREAAFFDLARGAGTVMALN